MNEEPVIVTEDSPLTMEEQSLLNQVLEEEHIGEAYIEEEHVEIPPNLPISLADEATSRFSSAVWYDTIKEKTIVLAGIGGIGSFCLFLLARVRPDFIYIYDDDIVEFGNISGQLYSTQDVGEPKTQAAAKICANFADYRSLICLGRFTEVSKGSDIMICGFDNMKSRRDFFMSWLNYVNTKSEEEKSKCLYIDGRLNAEEFQILCITGNDTFNINRYLNEFLFEDYEAEETICSYKQTTFCANMIASYMVNLFVNFCANEAGAYRELPFFTSYNAETMYLKTES